MARRAVYAGSFDPITNGHLDIIRRGAALVEHLVVAVGHNPKKRYLLDVAQRRSLVERATAGLHNVSVVSFSGLLVSCVQAEGADMILRGLRPLGDFDLEFRNGLANRDLSGVETLFLLADPSQQFISSSLIKEIASHGGDVTPYVPEGVVGPLQEALRL